MKTFSIATLLFLGINLLPQAQTKAADSVVINVGTNSKITIVIKDKKDLETLKQYNFQSLMDDLISKMETKDTTSMKPSTEYVNQTQQTTEVTQTKTETEENWNLPETEKSSSNDGYDGKSKKYHRGTRQSVSFDIGTNNYLTANGKFPNSNAPYVVRPWGSWYAAVNSVHRTRITRTFFVEWGLGLSQYNFKFQNDAMRVDQTVDGLNFIEDPRNSDPAVDINFIKSKLSATFINASFVPVLDFGGNYRKPILFDGRRSDSFRIGVGPYIGYRIDSFTRYVYKDAGDKEKRKDRGSYDLNNVRYGLRLQLGLKDTDLFFNYDLNELFTNGNDPQLTAFSFGISF